MLIRIIASAALMVMFSLLPVEGWLRFILFYDSVWSDRL